LSNLQTYENAGEIGSSIPKVVGSKFAEMQSRAFTQYLRKIAQHDCNQPSVGIEVIS
jgi:hypothetical protein